MMVKGVKWVGRDVDFIIYTTLHCLGVLHGQFLYPKVICFLYLTFNLLLIFGVNFLLFFCRYILKDHVNTLRFHACKEQHCATWTRLLNRVGFKVTTSTKVCSNHFRYGQPYPDEPSHYINQKWNISL